MRDITPKRPEILLVRNVYRHCILLFIPKFSLIDSQGRPFPRPFQQLFVQSLSIVSPLRLDPAKMLSHAAFALLFHYCIAFKILEPPPLRTRAVTRISFAQSLRQTWDEVKFPLLYLQMHNSLSPYCALRPSFQYEESLIDGRLR